MSGFAAPAGAPAGERVAPGSRPLPLAAVAALFLERQHLHRPRARRLGSSALARFVTDVGGIQMDTINVLDRAHHLTLWSRFGPYDRSRLERLVYREHVLFEYWAHAACLVPTGHFRYWRRAMLDYRVGHTGWARFLRGNPGLLGAIEAAIRERGPLANADFERPPGHKGSGWWTWKPATHALHCLWMTGRTLVHSRVHFQKRYDLAERVMPDALALAPPASEEFRRWHLRLALHAMGAASERDLGSYLTFPRWPASERRRTLRAALRSGEVVALPIAGERAPWFALAEDEPALERAARRRVPPSRGTTLLSPFDSFLWHRERTLRLFGFDYRLEVYTPGHKRVHGYYSLPILHDGRLIGRLDAKNHREERRLEVRSVHFEPWFAKGEPPPVRRDGSGPLAVEPALAGVGSALRSLAAFVEARRIVLGRVSPARMARPLARALRESGSPGRTR